ncbi:MAG: helix-turn-helix domain-containing protein [Halofilum sp. (in: g-proteobacteria)]|nr:helix-turn-helix domain-containing protein [Halofilum sp. (in: g-proteobacteria)]
MDAPQWLSIQPTLDALGSRNARRAYESFVAGGTEDEVSRFYAKQRASPVLGDAQFRAQALARAPDSPEIPRSERRRSVSVDEVLEAVAAEWGVDKTVLTARSRDVPTATREARLVAMQLCRDSTESTLGAIGEWFGGLHYSAVSQNIRRLQQRMEKDPHLAARLYSVASTCPYHGAPPLPTPFWSITFTDTTS